MFFSFTCEKNDTSRDSGLKVRAGGELPKVTIEITITHEMLGRDYGVKELYRGSSHFFVQRGLRSTSSAKL